MCQEIINKTNNSDNNIANDIHSEGLSDETIKLWDCTEFIHNLESESILKRRRITRMIFEVVSLVIFVIGILVSLFITETYAQNEAIKDSVLRLHIRANSNSCEDQQLKLKVRDEILNYIRPKLVGAKTKYDIIKICNLNKDNISKVAMKCMADNGYTYIARTRVDKDRFPTKEYPGVKLAAGIYDALIVELGSGKGNNWWCVCFPSLCLSGSAVENKEVMNEVIPSDCIELVTGDNTPKVRAKFFVLELIDKIINR